MMSRYHGVTSGRYDLEQGKRHPTLGNNVLVGSGAKIPGDYTGQQCPCRRQLSCG
jgi:serine acetyltransferase